MDRGAWWAMVHGVTKGWTGLKQLTPHTQHYFPFFFLIVKVIIEFNIEHLENVME